VCCDHEQHARAYDGNYGANAGNTSANDENNSANDDNNSANACNNGANACNTSANDDNTSANDEKNRANDGNNSDNNDAGADGVLAAQPDEHRADVERRHTADYRHHRWGLGILLRRVGMRNLPAHTVGAHRPRASVNTPSFSCLDSVFNCVSTQYK